MRDEFGTWDDFEEELSREYTGSHRGTRELRVRRLPSPGIAAVLSVLVPGLGHVYAGRLLAGGLWFLGVSFGYWAILVPGLLLHVLSVWTAYRAAERAEPVAEPVEPVEGAAWREKIP